MHFFRGTYTAIITPFTLEGAIDYDTFETLMEKQIEAGIDGLVVLGTTGESPTLSWEEHDDLIQKSVKIANGRTQIIAGTGSNCTAEAIEHSRKAQESGVDGLLLVSPYYNKPTQTGLYEHFRAVADSIHIPIMLYNIPGRCGVNIETDTLVRLTQHPNIQAVKEASGSVCQFMEVLASVPENFTVLSGDDNLTYPLLSLGGHGVVSVLANVLPVEVKSMVDSGLNGELAKARKEHYELLPLYKACFLETNPIPIKTMHALRGEVEESFRLPMCPMLPENVTKLKALMMDRELL